MKNVTVDKLLKAGLIKKATKVRLVAATDLKKSGLIRLVKHEKLILIAAVDLLKKGFIKKKE